MKKLNLLLQGHEMLSKKQMKELLGGSGGSEYETCTRYWANGTWDEMYPLTCSSDCECQAIYDEICERDDNCAGIDCGCK